VDAFLDAHREGAVTGHIHLGYWDRPPAGPADDADWRAAQDRLTERVLDMAHIADGQVIADVA
jgi:hypothetical protein